MEFERNTPATPQDIALADAPKVTLQPLNTEIHAESVQNNYSHNNEATFEFETEKTDGESVATNQRHPHTHIAAITSLACACVFGVMLFVIFAFR